MRKSATDVMQDVLFSAVIDAIGALKTASKGLPNTLLRDIGTIHPNTTFADLPKDVQAAIGASVRTAFTQLMKEGYTVAAKDAPPPRPGPAPVQRVERGGRGPSGPGPRSPGGPGRGPRPASGDGRGPRGPGGPRGRGPGGPGGKPGGPRRPS